MGRPETGMRYFDADRDSRDESSITTPASAKCSPCMLWIAPSDCSTGRFE